MIATLTLPERVAARPVAKIAAPADGIAFYVVTATLGVVLFGLTVLGVVCFINVINTVP